MSNRKKAKGNLNFAYAFFLFVAGLIVLSLFFRGIIFIKDSKFDGASHFTLEAYNVVTKKIQLISFSPRNSTIGILTLEGLDPKTLDIPVDATINFKNTFNRGNLSASLFKTISDFKDEKQINFIDSLRLFIFAKTVKDTSISEKSLDSQTDTVDVNSIISSLFIDSQISDEKLNIQVINSTNVFGLGNRLANYISNMGGNVILVSTGDEKKESEIEFVKDSYTVQKLSSILGFKTVRTQKKSLPDIIIIIGDDSLKNLKF